LLEQAPSASTNPALVAEAWLCESEDTGSTKVRNPRQLKMSAVATRTLLNLRMVVTMPALHIAGYLRTLL
jgi:hypothetical protein